MLSSFTPNFCGEDMPFGPRFVGLYAIFVTLDMFTVRVELSSAINNLKLRDGRKGEGKGF